MKFLIQLFLIFVVTVGIGSPDFITLETDSHSTITFELSTPDSDIPLDLDSETEKEVETIETQLFFTRYLALLNKFSNRLLLIPHECNLFDDYSHAIDIPPLV